MAPIAATYVTGLIIVSIYLMACWLQPFARCSLCAGTGNRRRAAKKPAKDCWLCKGRGRRLRLGRWLFNRFIKSHLEG